MYTPTLGEVRTAVTTQDRKQASEMLQTLLKEKPTADAWFLAAQLTKDRNKKVQYLRTALLLDNTHRKSIDWLRELGEDVDGNTLFIRSFLHELQEQANKSPFLRPFPPAVQAVIGVGIAIFLVVMFGLIASKLIVAGGPALSSDGPDVAASDFIQTPQVLDAFNGSGIDILFVEQKRDEVVGKDIIELDIRDEGNRSRLIEVFVYDSVKAILDDQNRLGVYDQATNVIAHANMIVVYPLDLSETTTTTIADVVQSNFANGGA